PAPLWAPRRRAGSLRRAPRRRRSDADETPRQGDEAARKGRTMSATTCLKSLTEVAARPIEWLWEGRIPRGKITILDGDPGVGKAALALGLAARVSRGAPMPLSRVGTTPADVVIFNDDDSLADTVRPRLEAAGADLTRIWACDRRITPADLGDLRP